MAAVKTPKLFAYVNGSACPVAVLSVPQIMLPEASVSRVFDPLQLRIVWSLIPPPLMTKPFIVEEADVVLRRVVEIPPANVEVAEL